MPQSGVRTRVDGLVADEWNGNDDLVADVRRHLAVAPDAGAMLVEPFLARKRALFAEHTWAVGKVEVRAPRLPGQGFIIYVEARGGSH